MAVVYIAVNLAFVHALGLEGLRRSDAVAADVLSLSIGPRAGQLISALICITALGGINGMVFTGARIFYAVGTDHRLFAWLGRWSSLKDTPVRPLVIQAAVAVGMIVGFGLNQKGSEGFNNSVAFTAPTFYLFLFLVGVALFVLRARPLRRRLPRAVIPTTAAFVLPFQHLHVLQRASLCISTDALGISCNRRRAADWRRLGVLGRKPGDGDVWG